MTTNQTIDGVSRAAIEILLSGKGGLAQAAAAHELRALLDSAPAGWLPCSPGLLESGVDCATAPRWSSKEWDGHSHWHPAPAAQPQGEPVAWHVQWSSTIPGIRGHREVVLKDPGALNAVVTPLYAEQPAPVAVSPTCCGSCPGGCVLGAKP
jgi:hypothetical protein